MAKTRLSIHDAVYRFCAAKIGYIECAGNEQQIMVENTTLPIAKPAISKDFGNPEFIILMITATVAATYAIHHSHNGTKFFNDTANNIVFAGAGDKIVKIPGANFIKIVPTVDQTTGVTVVATAIY